MIKQTKKFHQSLPHQANLLDSLLHSVLPVEDLKKLQSVIDDGHLDDADESKMKAFQQYIGGNSMASLKNIIAKLSKAPKANVCGAGRSKIPVCDHPDVHKQELLQYVKSHYLCGNANVDPDFLVNLLILEVHGEMSDDYFDKSIGTHGIAAVVVHSIQEMDTFFHQLADLTKYCLTGCHTAICDRKLVTRETCAHGCSVDLFIGFNKKQIFLQSKY